MRYPDVGLDRRLQVEFVYLAVLLDAFSRRVIGWALDRTLEAELPYCALLYRDGEGAEWKPAIKLRAQSL